MIIPDANLLLYAYDANSPHHQRAADWWEQCLSGTETVGLAPVVVFSFVRVGTNPRVFENPMTVIEAVQHVRAWLAQPNVILLVPGANHIEDALKLLESLGTAANLVSDAQLAAIALENGAMLHTADTDFLRFQGLRCFNPLTNARRRGA